MRGYEKFTVLECEEIEKVKRIGELHGNSKELKDACQEAYHLYRQEKFQPNVMEKSILKHLTTILESSCNNEGSRL